MRWTWLCSALALCFSVNGCGAAGLGLPKGPASVDFARRHQHLGLRENNGGQRGLLQAVNSPGLEVESSSGLEQSPIAAEGPAGAQPDALRLHSAIQAGLSRRVKSLLKKGADPNLDVSGTPPLWRAAIRNESAIVAMLLDFGADVNGLNSNGSTALYAAAQEGHVGIVQALLDSGADVDILSKWGSSALIVAASQGHADVVSALLEGGADFQKRTTEFQQSALFVAAANGYPQCVLALLEGRGEEMIDVPDVNGATPLYAACFQGQLASVDALLASKPDVDKVNEGGSGPLHAASANCFPKVVASLMDAGAQRGIRNLKGQRPMDVVCLAQPAAAKRRVSIQSILMPLMIAVLDDDSAEVQRLIQAGEDANGVASDGSTLLQLAVHRGSVRVVDALLAGSADSSVRDDDGRTPLHVAAGNSSTEIVAALLESGTDVNSLTSDRSTALHIAAQNNDAAIVEALVPFDPDPNIQDDAGRTPLHLAAQAGSPRIVQTLLDLGADPNIEDGEGHTPQFVAVDNEHVEVAELLKMAGKGTAVFSPAQVQSSDEEGRDRSLVAIGEPNIFKSNTNSSVAAWLIPLIVVPIIAVPAAWVFIKIVKRCNLDYLESCDVRTKRRAENSHGPDRNVAPQPHVQGYVNGVVSLSRGKRSEHWSPRDQTASRGGSAITSDGRPPLGGSKLTTDAAQGIFGSRTWSGDDDTRTASTASNLVSSQFDTPGSKFGGRVYNGTSNIFPPIYSDCAAIDDVLRGHERPLRSNVLFTDSDGCCSMTESSIAGSSSRHGQMRGSQRGGSGVRSMSVASWLPSEGSQVGTSRADGEFGSEDAADSGSPPSFCTVQPPLKGLTGCMGLAAQNHTGVNQPPLPVAEDMLSPHGRVATIDEGTEDGEMSTSHTRATLTEVSQALGGIPSPVTPPEQQAHSVKRSISDVSSQWSPLAVHQLIVADVGYASDDSVSSFGEESRGGTGTSIQTHVPHWPLRSVSIYISGDASCSDASMRSSEGQMIRQESNTSGVSPQSAQSRMGRQGSNTSGLSLYSAHSQMLTQGSGSTNEQSVHSPTESSSRESPHSASDNPSSEECQPSRQGSMVIHVQQEFSSLPVGDI
eukprot:evm.model.scf_705.8 EVM.evm.TU.scf_705.8   scf_705:58250-63787(-)